MRYAKLGSSDLNVSVIGAGTWAMGGDSFGRTVDEDCMSAIRTAVENGINLIDTAPAYGAGHAEEVVGKAIQGIRSEVIVATKVGVYRNGEDYIKDLTAASIPQQIDGSLKRLGIDCIDLLQIHWPDPKVPLELSLDVLDKEQQKGKFRYLGVSNFDTKLLEQASARLNIVSLQPPLSLLDQAALPLLTYCDEHNLGTLTYGSLGAGALTDKYIDNPPTTFASWDVRSGFYPWFAKDRWPQVAELLKVLSGVAKKYGVPTSFVSIGWVLAQKGATTALVGIKNPGQAKQNALAGDFVLPQEAAAYISAEYKKIFG